ncbi:MAG: phage tail tape measure protein [Lachnospiraceae bacterium]|nr:phage tail tape measure protein [Lachnospiraceae bacterium]
MQFKNLGNSINAITDIENIYKRLETIPSGLPKLAEETRLLNSLTSTYSTEVLKLAIAQTTLDETQIKAILSAKGLKGEILETTTAELAQTTATNALSASEATATGTTGGLSTAFKGLAASLGISTAALGALVAGVAAVGVAAIAINKYKQYLEEIRQATEEAANAYKESSSSINDYVAKYTELREALIKAKGNEEETYNIKKQLLDLQTELNDKFGDEYDRINLVTDAYKDQTESIKEYNKEAAKRFLNENREGIETAVEKMTKDRHYNLSLTGISLYSDEGAALKEIAEKYKDQGITLLDELGDGSYAQFSVHLEADAQSAYETINAFESDLRDKANELGNEHMFGDALDISSASLNDAMFIINKYGGSFKEALTAEIALDDNKAKTYGEALKAVQAYNEAVLRSENPYDDQNVIQAKENLDEIKTSIQSNEEEWGKYSILFDNVFDQADTRLLEFNEAIKTDGELQEFAKDLEGLNNLDLQALDENVGENNSFDKLKESAKEYKVDADELIDTLIRLGYVQGEIQSSVLTDVDEMNTSLSISETIDQLNTQLKPAFDSLKSAYQDIFTDNGFTLENVDIPMLESIKSSIEEINKLEDAGIDIDIRAFDKFATTLTDVNTTEEQAKQAFNDFATEIFNASTATDGMTEETVQMVEQLLESLGIVNAEEVALNALSEAKARAITNSYDLANATEEDIAAMLSEAQAAGITNAEIFKLVTAEQVFDQQGLNPKEKIEKLKELANAYGQTAIATRIANMEIGAEKGHTSINYEDELASLQNQINNAINNVQIDFSGVTKSAGSAGKSAGDAYVDAFEKELKELDDLRDRGVIDEAEYLHRLRELYTRYFADRKEYLDEFRKYERQYLEGMKSLYDSALSGISKLMDSKIDSYTESKEAAIESLEAEQQAAEDAYQSQIDAIDDMIAKKQEIIDSIQDEIDTMREAREERQRQIDLQKAQYELERMQNQQTMLVYSEGKGMHYRTDESGIRDAKEAVDDAKFEIEVAAKEKEINLLEDEIDLLEKQKDALEEAKEASNKYYETLINQQEQYWDSMIKSMEQQKSKWEELAEIEEIADAYSKVYQVFNDLGYSVEDVLNGSDAAFEDFKSKYISILSEMNQNTSFQEGLEYASGAAKESFGSIVADAKDSIQQLSQTFSDGTFSNAIATGISEGMVSAKQELDKMNQLGSDAGEGFIEGWNEKSSEVSDATKQTAIDAVDAFAEGFNFENSSLNTSFDALKLLIESVTEALGISTDGTVGGLLGALTQLSDFSFSEDSIIKQFDNLKTAIDEVTSAISGGGVSSDGEGQGGGSGSAKGGKSGGKGSKNGSNSNSLKNAITDIGTTASTVIGQPEAEGDGTVIGEFGSLETAVGDVTAAIGSGDSKGGNDNEQNINDEDNLIGSIINLGETTEETLGESGGDGVTGRFEEFRDVIGEANEHVHSISDGLDEIDGQEVECTIKVKIETTGGLPAEIANSAETGLDHMNLDSAEYNAKYIGKARVEGTALASGNWAVQSDEKKSLVGEKGYEIVVRKGRFFTVGNNGAEMFDIKRGDIVFNHEQSKNLLKYGHISGRGKAYADGTVGGGRILTPDGHILRPLLEGDRGWDLMQKFQPLVDKMLKGEADIMSNAMIDHQKQIEQMVRDITTTNIAANTNNKPSVAIGDIHVTCPGVTEQQVAEKLGGVIGKELDKQFNGFHNYTDQMSRIR